LTFPRKTGTDKTIEFWQNSPLGKGDICHEKDEIYRRADCISLRQAETGTRVIEVCRKMGILDATF